MNPLILLTYQGKAFEKICNYFTCLIFTSVTLLIPFDILKAQELSPGIRKVPDVGTVQESDSSRKKNVAPKLLNGTFILNPVADAYVRSGNNASYNFGNIPDLATRNNTFAKGIYYTYLKFDIAAVNNIAAAKLRLYGRGDKNISTTVNVLSVRSETWNDNTITWNNKPGEDNTILATTNVSGATAQYYEWDLTQHILNLRNSGARYVSLVLKNSSTTSGLIRFNSADNAVNKPELQITGSGSSTALTAKSEIDFGLSFSIYPNPTSNYLQLKYSPEFNNHKLQLLDMNGRLIKTILLTGTTTQTISVYDLKEGTYFLNTEINHRRYIQRVVIKK